MLQSSNLFLNMTTEEDSTTYSGSLFHTLIILWVKKHFLTCNLHLLTFDFQLWPLRTCPPPSSSSNNSSNSTLSKPLTILKTWIKSPLILLFSNDVDPQRLQSFFIRFILQALYQFGCSTLDLLYTITPRGAGYPLSAFAPPLSIHFLIFCSLLPFPFSFSHPLYLFSSTVHLIPFYQNSPTPFPGVRS